MRPTGAGIVLTAGFLNGHPSDAQLSRADLLADHELKVLGLNSEKETKSKPVVQCRAKPASCMKTIQHHAGTAVHRGAQSERYRAEAIISGTSAAYSTRQHLLCLLSKQTVSLLLD